MASKRTKFGKGDIVLVKGIIEPYGHGVGPLRPEDMVYWEGEMGEVYAIYPSAKYRYHVKLKMTNKVGRLIERRMKFIEDELDSMFTV